MAKRRIEAVLLTLVLFMGCGSESSTPAPPAPSTSEISRPTPPTSIRPKPTVVLQAGQTYQVSTQIPLLSAMSNDPAIITAAIVIPAGGYFQCIQKELQGEGNWYSVQIWDGGGNVYTGYIDAERLSQGSAKPYVANSQVPSQSQGRAATQGFARGNFSQPTQSLQSAGDGAVYIAPQSGRKYHSSQDCRGLKGASQVVSTTAAQAQAQGYEACKICGGGH